ncbi:MAG: hypothetical protein QG567_699 [Campylobacterota bacterium]|nr:hypothetical protein [Campylobacterota bacterium]
MVGGLSCKAKAVNIHSHEVVIPSETNAIVDFKNLSDEDQAKIRNDLYPEIFL